MKRIKIIYGSSQSELQYNIDRWIKDEKIEIINCSLTTDNDSDNIYLAIVYDDSTQIKI